MENHASTGLLAGPGCAAAHDLRLLPPRSAPQAPDAAASNPRPACCVAHSTQRRSCLARAHRRVHARAQTPCRARRRTQKGNGRHARRRAAGRGPGPGRRGHGAGPGHGRLRQRGATNSRSSLATHPHIPCLHTSRLDAAQRRLVGALFGATSLTDGCMQDAPFRINQRLYERQYAQLYFARLRLMAEALEKEAARRWPGVQRERATPGQRASPPPPARCCGERS